MYSKILCECVQCDVDIFSVHVHKIFTQGCIYLGGGGKGGNSPTPGSGRFIKYMYTISFILYGGLSNRQGFVSDVIYM